MSDDALEVKNNSKASYDVGFKKPPRHSQFAKGKSGNPNGRPRGSKNKQGENYYKTIDDLILNEAYREVELTQDGARIKMPVLQAALRAMTVKAVQGNMRANIHLAKSVSAIENKRQQIEDRQIEEMINYKVDWEIEIERRHKLGIELPDLEVNPNDIVVDHENARAYVKKSLTDEQKQAIANLSKMKVAHEQEIKLIEEMIEDSKHADFIDMLKIDLKRSKNIVKRLEKLIPD